MVQENLLLSWRKILLKMKRKHFSELVERERKTNFGKQSHLKDENSVDNFEAPRHPVR
jgi:hypothetical protein